MRYGHFDTDADEYVITRPDVPMSWTNSAKLLRLQSIARPRRKFADRRLDPKTLRNSCGILRWPAGGTSRGAK